MSPELQPQTSVDGITPAPVVVPSKPEPQEQLAPSVSSAVQKKARPLSSVRLIVLAYGIFVVLFAFGGIALAGMFPRSDGSLGNIKLAGMFVYGCGAAIAILFGITGFSRIGR